MLYDEDGKEHALFTGDTLFDGDVGRPDLAQKATKLTKEDIAGWLYDSLRTQIMSLRNYALRSDMTRDEFIAVSILIIPIAFEFSGILTRLFFLRSRQERVIRLKRNKVPKCHFIMREPRHQLWVG